MARLWVGLLAVVACSRAPSSPPPAPAPVPPPAPAPAPAAKAEVRKPMQLELEKPVPLGGDAGTTIVLKSFTVEQIAAHGSYPGGSGVTMHLTVAGEPVSLSELSAGYDSQKVGWTSRHRVELAGSDDRPPSVRVLVDEIGREPLPGTMRTARVERDKTVDLGDGVAMRFAGHGHKVVEAGGPDSPLIVRVEYLEGTSAKPESYNLDLPGERVWRWRDHWFRLGEHEYDRFMVLELARLPLVPR